MVLSICRGNCVGVDDEKMSLDFLRKSPSEWEISFFIYAIVARRKIGGYNEAEDTIKFQREDFQNTLWYDLKKSRQLSYENDDVPWIPDARYEQSSFAIGKNQKQKWYNNIWK